VRLEQEIGSLHLRGETSGTSRWTYVGAQTEFCCRLRNALRAHRLQSRIGTVSPLAAPVPTDLLHHQSLLRSG
jgi:hypothetical protein